MNSPVSLNIRKSLDKNDFHINEVIFAKIKGYPFWPAKITGIDNTTYKNVTKYCVQFFATEETALVTKTNICHYKENRIKYSLDTVANKHKGSYKRTLEEIG